MLDKWFAAAGAAAWGGVAFRRLLPVLSTGAREKVETLCPAPETVLVAAFPYYAGERPGNLSLYARGEDYHRVVTRRLNTVCDALRRKSPEESHHGEYTETYVPGKFRRASDGYVPGKDAPGKPVGGRTDDTAPVRFPRSPMPETAPFRTEPRAAARWSP